MLVISLALTLLFLYSGFWYGVIIAGLLSTAFVSMRPIYSIALSTVVSMAAFIIFEIPLLMAGLLRLMYYVGAIAGINGSLLVILAILLDGVMALGGSFVGVFINRSIVRRKTGRYNSEVKI
ncbi:hypothetical membrane protein [Thermoplasma acidophilum]|uniref:Hypothetical membrane protein n=1 Tax=Thermoplasma acidophilum (strain ATCC 25905 / DSM 1728 / JCM 9062 / NBRC 15155 / AMRC-C165) TaxID=273075 RepID=Q9HKC4_THEAC|nr:hypothetical membrane protein [Thermoplasma acidophilum]